MVDLDSVKSIRISPFELITEVTFEIFEIEILIPLDQSLFSGGMEWVPISSCATMGELIGAGISKVILGNMIFAIDEQIDDTLQVDDDEDMFEPLLKFIMIKEALK